MREFIFDIPSLPGYGITKSGKLYREDREISFRAYEYIIAEVHKEGKRTSVRQHRLLAEVFIPNPKNLPQVNHKDGDKHNNSLDNLEWCTPSENVKHSYETGLASNKGSRHPRSKFTESDIAQILDLRSQGIKLKDIAALYNVHFSTIGKITTKVHYAGSNF